MIVPTLDEFLALARQGNLVPVCREILADLETPVSAFLKVHRGPLRLPPRERRGRREVGPLQLPRHRAGARAARARPRGRDRARRAARRAARAGRSDRRAERLLARVPPGGGARAAALLRRRGRLRRLRHGARRSSACRPRRDDDLGLPDACLLLAESLLVFDNVAQTIKVVSNAHLRDGRSTAQAYDARRRAHRRAGRRGCASRAGRAAAARTRASRRRRSPRRTSPRRATRRWSRRAKEYIRAGDVFQVVLAQRFELPLAAAPFDVYRCLRTVNPSPYMFYLELGDHALAGASPEVMVRVEDGEVTRAADRRHARRAARPSEDDARSRTSCVDDPKELAEHVMLLDLGRNDVGRVARDRAPSRSRATGDRALLARHAPGLERARPARRRAGRVRRAPRGVPRGHAHRRAQDPRHGDHRGARAGAARRLRRRGRLLRLLREHGHRHRDPHGRSSAAGGSTCRPAPASSPTRIPRPSTASASTRRARMIQAVRLAETL